MKRMKATYVLRQLIDALSDYEVQRLKSEREDAWNDAITYLMQNPLSKPSPRKRKNQT